MDKTVFDLLTQLPMVALMFFLYLTERTENKKIVAQNRTDSLRHEETIMRLVYEMGTCPVISSKRDIRESSVIRPKITQIEP